MRTVAGSIACVILAVVALVSVGPAGAATLPPNDPARAIAANPEFGRSCVGDAVDNSAACQAATLQAIDNARAAEGVGALVLPTNYASLTAAEQLFMVTDIERVDRGLSPITGLNAALDASASDAAASSTDPLPPAGYPYRTAGGIFAAGQSNVLAAVYDWMYFDGFGGDNYDCTTSITSGCWVHRNVMLGTYGSPSSMGAAERSVSLGGTMAPDYTAVFVGDPSGPQPQYSFTWASEAPYLTPAPSASKLSPSSGPARGGTTVTLTGHQLGKVTGVNFGLLAGTGLRASSDGTSLTVVAPARAEVGPVTVTIVSAQGSTSAGTFTYVASTPSAPTSLTATPGTDRATLRWAAPAATGGSAILRYEVVPFLGGKTAQAAVTFAASATSGVVNGLADGSTYTFQVDAVNAVGAGQWSAASAMVLPPFRSLAAFVTQQVSLERGATAASFIGGLRRSTDATTNVDPVTRLYFAYLLRIPDAGGLQFWIAKKRAGTTPQQISSSFAASSEFTTRYGNLTNEQFVELVYQNVLGRAGDASGIAYWTGQLDTGAKNRGAVMVGFSESSEYKTLEQPSVDVAVSWIDLFGTAPDSTDFTTWVTAIKGGKASATTLAANLLATASYAARMG
jgi:hypothetical protein